MKFSELTIRQSVRKYQEKPVEDEKIVQLIEAVRLSPSASNSQPWKVIIVVSYSEVLRSEFDGIVVDFFNPSPD